MQKKSLFLLRKFPRAQKSTVQYRANLNPPMLIFPSELNECVGKRRRGEKKIHLANLLERETLMKRGEIRDAPHKVFPFLKISLILPYCVYGKLDGGEISQCEKDN